MKHIFPILITFILFEIFLRYSPFSNGISPVEYDSEIGMWHKKNFSNYIISSCYRTEYSFDEYGRVKSLYDLDKSKKDIILLGDSQIEALMVQKENRLQNRLYSNLDNKYNVLNYGLSGTSTAQQYQILINKANLDNVEYVLQFLFLENDLHDSNKFNTGILERTKVFMKFENLEKYELIKPSSYNYIEIIRDIVSNYEFYFFVKKIIYFLKDSINSFFDKVKLEDTNTEILNKNIYFSDFTWMQLQGPIFLTKKLLSKKSIKYKIFFVSKNVNEQELNKFKGFLRDIEVEYFDLEDFFNQDYLKEKQLFFSCDSHFNDFANIILSKYLRGNIEDY